MLGTARRRRQWAGPRGWASPELTTTTRKWRGEEWHPREEYIVCPQRVGGGAQTGGMGS